MGSKVRLYFDGVFFLMLACALLILPLRWVIAWCMAVAAHEAGHYASLRLFSVQVQSITFSPTGIRMQTGYLTPRAEFFCAVSGPLAGFSVLLLSKYIPYTAFCAFLHSAFNLLPVYPMDGGRVLRVILAGLLKNERIACTTEKWISLLLFCSLSAFAVKFHLGLGVILGNFLIFVQNILANREKKQYNRGKQIFEVRL